MPIRNFRKVPAGYRFAVRKTTRRQRPPRPRAERPKITIEFDLPDTLAAFVAPGTGVWYGVTVAFSGRVFVDGASKEHARNLAAEFLKSIRAPDELQVPIVLTDAGRLDRAPEQWWGTFVRGALVFSRGVEKPLICGATG